MLGPDRPGRDVAVGDFEIWRWDGDEGGTERPSAAEGRTGARLTSGRRRWRTAAAVAASAGVLLGLGLQQHRGYAGGAGEHGSARLDHDVRHRRPFGHHGGRGRIHDDRLDRLRRPPRVRQGPRATGLVRPDGEQIELSVIRYPATKPDQRIGSMVQPGRSRPKRRRPGPRRRPELAGWGDGRFDIGWDPRGTFASSPMHCFESDAEEAAFWKDVAIPYTAEESAAYQLKMVDLAQRCGEVMGPLLSHISTADTVARPRRHASALGEEQITYVGFSYGTMLGQTYANMFPERVRAMMLDGVVDAVPYTNSAEDRAANNAGSPDAVFAQFAELCDAAGPTHCALAGHPGQTAAERVDQLFDTLRTGTIPAPNADPPGELVYTDLQLTLVLRRCATRSCGRSGPSS